VSVRVAVVGARRVRQGTGPFLAMQCAAAGARVCALWCRSPSGAAAAAEFLARRGVLSPPYTDWEALLAETRPEALVLAIPAPAHREWLERALGAGLHVLCEKPLLLPETSEGAEDLVAAYAAAGLVLAENCQWPWTLTAFRSLHPEFRFEEATRFRMRMAPSGESRTRWEETLSHPLSLLQATLPAAPGVVSETAYPSPEELEFHYTAGSSRLRCRIELTDPKPFPRTAEYAFDDALCRRRIHQPGYRFQFEDGRGAAVSAPDPMQVSVDEFLHRVNHARSCASAPPDPVLVQRQKLLADLLLAFPSEP